MQYFKSLFDTFEVRYLDYYSVQLLTRNCIKIFFDTLLYYNYIGYTILHIQTLIYLYRIQYIYILVYK